jgi:hypothetical protein
MSDLYYFNTSFDFELAGALTEKLRAVCSETSLLSIFVMREGDAAICDVDVDDSYCEYISSLGFSPHIIRKEEKAEGCTGIAWGWNASSYERLRHKGSVCHCSDLEAVKLANSRVTSSRIAKEKRFPVAGEICKTFEEVERCIAEEKSRPLLVKPVFGSSGSGFMKIIKPHLEDNDKKRLTILCGSDGVCIEKLLDRIDDYGINFNIDSNGLFSLYGMHKALISKSGKFGGIVSADIEEEIRSECESAARIAAEELYAIGYFGPAGIDAFTYNDNGICKLNPMCEINARYSMGFVARSCAGILGGKYSILRYIRTSRISLPKHYKDIGLLFGKNAYDAENKKGILLLSPLRINYQNDIRSPLFSLIYIAADSAEERDRFLANSEQVIDR